MMFSHQTNKPCLLIFLAIVFFSEQVCCAENAAVETDPEKDHIKIAMNWTPNIKIYDNMNLKGTPVLFLDAKGLWCKGKLACSWPGGLFDNEHQPNRVLKLQYEKLQHEKEKKCPQNFPFKSGFGDRGIGTAVLYLEVTKRHGNIVETEFEGKPCYFDLNVIPDGMWKWEISEEKKIKAGKLKVSQFFAKTKFNDFLSEIRECVRQCCVKECLPKYFAKKFETESYLTRPDVFNDRICSEKGAHTLKYFASCFEAKDYPEIEVSGDTRVTLNGLNGYFCHLEFENGKWHIEHYGQGD